MATGREDASLLVDALYVDAKKFFEDVEFRVEIEIFATEDPRTAKGGTTYHDGIDAVSVESFVSFVE